MGWFKRWRESRSAQVGESPPTVAAAPGRRAAALNANGRVPVVGVRYRQEALARALARGRVQSAVLVPEFANPHDPAAVAVYVAGEHIGYLCREDAAAYRPALEGLWNEGVVGCCPVSVERGTDLTGLLLHLGDPEIVIDSAATPLQLPRTLSGPVVALNPRGDVQVFGESRHQEHLQRLVLRRQDHVAELWPNDAGGVEVRIAGKRVGELYYRDVRPYRRRLEPLWAEGRRPQCPAFLAGSTVGVFLRLAPAEHMLDRDWDPRRAKDGPPPAGHPVPLPAEDRVEVADEQRYAYNLETYTEPTEATAALAPDPHDDSVIAVWISERRVGRLPVAAARAWQSTVVTLVEAGHVPTCPARIDGMAVTLQLGPPPARAALRRPAAAEAPVRVWCENGQHYWERPMIRGRRPHNCPEHP